MSGTHNVTQALKRLLRQAGITYADAAEALDLSEASVKRLFAQQSFTLSRLETLSKLAGAELVDLIRLSDDLMEVVEELPLEVEQALVDEPRLLLCVVCVLNRFQFEDVLQLYEIDRHDLQQLFAALDRLNIIELLEANRYRRKLSRGFKWRSGGPIERFFVDRVLRGFFNPGLIRSGDQFRFAWGTVTAKTADHFLERLRLLSQEFNEAADRDAKLGIGQRNGAALMLAFRTNWEPEEFVKLKSSTAS